MDFDEIQTVIVNAHLAETMATDGKAYRWRLRGVDNGIIVDLLERYRHPKNVKWVRNNFLSDPAGLYMFIEYMKTLPEESARNIYRLEFFAGLEALVKADKANRRVLSSRLIVKFYGSHDPRKSRSAGDKGDPLLVQRGEWISDHDLSIVHEVLDDPDMPVEDLAQIMADIGDEIWDIHFPAFSQTELFLRFIQLYEYSHRKVAANAFAKIRIVGKGAFGAVYAVEKLDTHKVYAWKQMDKRKLKHDKSFDVALNEMKRLSEIRSPFVTQLKYCLETENSVAVIMDFHSGGDLKYHMRYASPDKKKKPFAPDVAQFFAAEILLALEVMHENAIIFRDLKPANILLDDLGHVHVSDLGLAKKLTRERPYSTGLSGTPGYWSPEVLCRTPYSVWVDWWSFGIVLYELLSGKRPPCVCKRGSKEWCTFSDRKESEINALSDDGVYAQNIQYPVKYFTPDAEDLISRLLFPKKSMRLGYNGTAEIKNHPYFVNIDWEAMMCKRLVPPFQPKV